MEPADLLLGSQEPTTYPCYEPEQSSLNPLLFVEDQF